jgi:signal peptidase I
MFFRMSGRHAVESHAKLQRNVISPVSAVLILLSLFACGSSGQTSVATTASSPPLFSAGPITDYKAALPKPGDVLQFRRGERYNIDNPHSPEIGENSKDDELGFWQGTPSHYRKDAMPFAASDAVAIGIVTSGQAYLSNDKRDLYSEFKCSLSEVIKNPRAPYLRTGDAVDIQRRGGAVRLPSDKVLTRGADWESMPCIGTRYLLFLKYDPSTEDYSILMGYELAGNEVYRLDEINEKDAHYSQIAHPLRAEGATESEFLERAKSKLVPQKAKAN